MASGSFLKCLGLKNVKEVIPGWYMAEIANEYKDDWKDDFIPLGAVKDGVLKGGVENDF